MIPKKDTQKSAKSTTATGRKSKGFTDDERGPRAIEAFAKVPPTRRRAGRAAPECRP
jgi:hypothetical protein